MRGNRKQRARSCTDRQKSQSQIGIHRKHVGDEGAAGTMRSITLEGLGEEKGPQRSKEEDSGTTIADRILQKMTS